ncbi:hypothetical protein K435DRAFT_799976 [Dendrothele bispora CBS 962.96]|uniref:Uncharacterized protein n=1 Tax=Dendrothele bispora (strain CBS 962.96) TaxID=1314807 RepID=A0A4S8LVH3_DENBC|nr:hypothetical protein K435DRAFT_799976 [Dendrothele bispora CBS 962.96]
MDNSPIEISDSDDDNSGAVPKGIKIVIPKDKPEAWPGSYYVVDLYWVFLASRQRELHGKGNAEELFRLAFPAVRTDKAWPKSNFYALRKLWEKAPDTTKQRFIKAGRTRNGSWKCFAATVAEKSNGLARLKAEKQKIYCASAKNKGKGKVKEVRRAGSRNQFVIVSSDEDEVEDEEGDEGEDEDRDEDEETEEDELIEDPL